MLYILLAILAGVSIIIARIINSTLAEKIGIFQGTFFNYFTGLITSIIFMFISKDYLIIKDISFAGIPFYAYLGGALGVLVVLLSNYTTPKTSAFYLTLFVFIGQLLLGVIIDYMTLGSISIGKIIGGLLVLCGLSYNLILDFRPSKVK